MDLRFGGGGGVQQVVGSTSVCALDVLLDWQVWVLTVTGREWYEWEERQTRGVDCLLPREGCQDFSLPYMGKVAGGWLPRDVDAGSRNPGGPGCRCHGWLDGIGRAGIWVQARGPRDQGT